MTHSTCVNLVNALTFPLHILGLMGRVLHFESVTKNELHYLKMELECQLGDHGDDNGDASSSPLWGNR